MKRRDFIKAAIAAGVTLTFPGNTGMILSSLEAADKVDLADRPWRFTCRDNESGH